MLARVQHAEGWLSYQIQQSPEQSCVSDLDVSGAGMWAQTSSTSTQGCWLADTSKIAHSLPTTGSFALRLRVSSCRAPWLQLAPV